MTTTEWLQRWYQRACNGVWEHAHGVKIDTLDNPGWHVQIDLADTPYAQLSPRQKAVEHSETDWLRCSVSQQQFLGYGGPEKLDEIIAVFKEWIEGFAPTTP
jgi:hypothetical protein